jgi:hypothetical protein
MRNGGPLLLPIAALLLPMVATISAGDRESVQIEGILQPYDWGGVCDWGQTHLVAGACTDEFAFVYSDTTAYDCQYVYLEGSDVTPATYCPLTIAATVIVPVAPPCLLQVRGLTLRPIYGGHRLEWAYFGCANSYDVIRGTVSNLAARDLGAVHCLANDESTSRFDDLSGDEPLPGECFFYLVRPNGPTGFLHYGHSSSGATRSPATGDCPPA